MEVLPSGLSPDAQPYRRERIPTGAGNAADILTPDPRGPNSVRCLAVSAASPDRLARDNALTTWQEWLAGQPPVESVSPFNWFMPGSGPGKSLDALLQHAGTLILFGIGGFVLWETRGTWGRRGWTRPRSRPFHGGTARNPEVGPVIPHRCALCDTVTTGWFCPAHTCQVIMRQGSQDVRCSQPALGHGRCKRHGGTRR